MVSFSGPGNPVYSGPPEPRVVRAIQKIFYTDSEGLRYWRDLQGTLRRLRSSDRSFANANALLDRYRRRDGTF